MDVEKYPNYKDQSENMDCEMITLEEALDDYCPCCSRGDESTLDYIKEHDTDPEALYNEVIRLQKDRVIYLMDILLRSDYDIFVPWFKKVLIHYSEKENGGIKSQASEILSFYKESFDEID